MAIDKKVRLNGGKVLTKGKGFNYLQTQHTWLPQMPTQKNFTHPFTNKPTYFDYSKKIKDLLGDMITYVSICKLIRTSMFATHSDEFMKDFYTDLVSDAYLKCLKSIGNWKPCYDILRFAQCHVNFSWLSVWTMYKEEKKVITGILDPNLHLSYVESLELFNKYIEGEQDEEMTRMLEAQAKLESDEVDDLNDLVD